MGRTSGKSWHTQTDSAEQIEMCLVCTRSDCIDCIGRRLEGVVGCKPRKRRKTRKED